MTDSVGVNIGASTASLSNRPLVFNPDRLAAVLNAGLDPKKDRRISASSTGSEDDGLLDPHSRNALELVHGPRKAASDAKMTPVAADIDLPGAVGRASRGALSVASDDVPDAASADWEMNTSRFPVYTTYEDVVDSFVEKHEFAQQFSDNVKLCIVVTIFNEEELELRRTLEGLSENMASLQCTPDELVICIVADGRPNLTASALAMGDTVGICDSQKLAECAAEIEAGRKTVGLHLFENPSVAMTLNTPDELRIPMIFAIKEKNAGKLSSHRFFFMGLCARLKPQAIVLLDAGTQPKPNAIQKLWEAFLDNPHLGGVCGELKVFQPQCTQIVNSAQQFEYKMSHIMDKAMESVLGYVSVLPGAFSAYRYEAVVGAPLEKYFHAEDNPITSPFVSNMYLAEDRILGFEVLAKDNCRWVLEYANEAVADTDVPDSIVGLVKQRRRWLNGAFFSLLFSLINFHRVFIYTNHTYFRKLLLFSELFYMLVNLFSGWFTLANMYLSVYIVMSVTITDRRLLFLFMMLYSCLTALQFVLALSTTPADFPNLYIGFAVIHGCLFASTVGSLGAFLGSNVSDSWLYVIGFSAIISYALCAIIYGEVCFVATSAMQYLLMVPTFMSVIMVFAFCNVHDVSWGTREAAAAAAGAQTKEAKERAAKLAAQQVAQAKRMRRARAWLVCWWLLMNSVFICAVMYMDWTDDYATAIVTTFAWLLLFRTGGSVVYRLNSLLMDCWRYRKHRAAAAEHDARLAEYFHRQQSLAFPRMATPQPKDFLGVDIGEDDMDLEDHDSGSVEPLPQHMTRSASRTALGM